MSMPFWSLFLGVLMITMLLVGKGLTRLPLSNAMVYLGVGYLLGPGGLNVISLDPTRHAQLLEGVAQIALLISLFTVGLKMGSVPLLDGRWILPLRLAFVTMAITVGLITLVGMWGLGLSMGAAVLLGGILAPTDPVLASGVQTRGGVSPDHLRFSLTGEGGLNDATAFPFVLLGLGLLGKYDLGAHAWRWWAVDVFWSMGAGLLIGATLGALLGRLVVRLRTRHQQAVGFDEFLSLGLMAAAYGAAQICLASGFLAVLAAGLALQRVQEQPRTHTRAAANPARAGGAAAGLAVDPDHASAAMSEAVQGFNEQLEKLAEPAVVLIVGVMLPHALKAAQGSHALWWFIPLLFTVLRTIAVSLGMLGERTGNRMAVPQRAMISWFGIRGIGSVFYLMFALRHGVSGHLAQQLISFALVTVAASIVVHGVSVRLLMQWYMRRKAEG